MTHRLTTWVVWLVRVCACARVKGRASPSRWLMRDSVILEPCGPVEKVHLQMEGKGEGGRNTPEPLLGVRTPAEAAAILLAASFLESAGLPCTSAPHNGKF